MKERQLFFLLIGICVVVMLYLPLTSAKPPFQQSDISTGLIIEVPVITYIQQNQDHDFHAHVHNASSGRTIPHAEIEFCFLHIYNQTGNHIIETNMTQGSNGFDYEFLILGGNFSSIGQYAAYIYCQVNQSVDPIGGFFEYGFDVTVTGEEPRTSSSLLYFLLLIGVSVTFFFLVYLMLMLEFGNFIDNDSGMIAINWKKYLKVFLIPVNYVLLMWIFAIAYNISNSYLYLTSITNFFYYLYYVMLVTLLPLTIVCLYGIIVWFINDKKIYKALERGTPI